MLKIAAAANVEIEEPTQAVYVERLVTLSRAEFDLAVRHTIDEWDRPHLMPPLAFILARTGGNVKLAAEQAWELAWKLVKRDWYADGIGWVAGSQGKLTPAMQYAIRQCGGEFRMAYADEESFPFIRRDFIQSHERFSLEDGEQVRLTQGEASDFLKQLHAMRSEPKLIPEIAEGVIPEEPRTIQRPIRQLTAEEHEARIAELKRQAGL